MPELATHTDIHASVDLVYAVLRDVGGYVSYFKYITAVSILSETQHLLIAELTEEIYGFKQHVRACFQFEPPHRVVVEQIKGPFRSATAEFLLEPLSEGTRLDHRITFEVKKGLLRGAVQRAFADSVVEARMQEEVAAIKRVAEQTPG